MHAAQTPFVNAFFLQASYYYGFLILNSNLKKVHLIYFCNLSD